jgi:hypothetical protein
MNKEEKIRKLVQHWVSNMDLLELEDFYTDIKMEELSSWDEEDLDYYLEGNHIS